MVPAKATIPRPIGRWTAIKLEHLDHYLQAYVTASKRSLERSYIDGFAGCGDCMLEGTGIPVEGSAVRALRAVPAFTEYHLVEIDPASAQHLRSKVAGHGNVSVYTGDCNVLLPTQVLPRVSKRSASLAFLDPTGLQLHWDTIVALASHRTGPRRMELLILYPFDMAIDPRLFNVRIHPALTRFFGSQSGWELQLEESGHLQENRDQRRDRFVRFYCARLRQLGYQYVDEYGPLYDEHNRPLYNVVFASDHPVGAKIMKSEWSATRFVPGELGYSAVRRPKPQSP